MNLHYAGTCTAGEPLPAGTRAFYDPRDRTTTCTDLEHAKAAGLTKSEWYGAPTSGRWLEVLSERRLDSFARRSRRGGRCTHEDYPCCGCER